MRRMVALIFLAACSLAFAQQSGPDTEPVQDSETPAVEDDTGDETTGEEGEEGQQGEAGEEDQVPADEDGATAEEEALADLPPAVETNPIPEPPEEDELADADEEFEPGEEISEDYPVPLPSDI